MRITPEIVAKHGLTPQEYERIRKILGRQPNLTELGIFSVMWSEHCSYKSSKPELKKFPREAPFILVKAGEENAGIVDIGDGWAVAFKIESHNHPSAVEPFQGAATGVGGIIRDIFTMGARPVLLMNSLRFGPIDGGRGIPAPSGRNKNVARTEEQIRQNRRLFAGVVAGIAHYGNCVGIPNVGGEIYFDDCYTGNPLVNVLCAGVLRHEQIKRGKASGVGNPVIYVGSATGRDGLAGAAFASRELTGESHEDRPAVQVGDPFMEKLLLEACLEVMQEDGLVVGIQDMGAAGLTCSTCETASRGGTGIEIDLEKVPKRETGLTPYEIMLSESQERMLLIAQKGREREVEEIFQKWDLHGVVIGRVTDDGVMRVKVGNEIVAEIPVKALTDDAPVHDREARPVATESSLLQNQNDLLEVLASPTIASKNWVYRQYDHMVQNRTVVGPGSDAAVIRIAEAGKYIAFTTDGNARYCRLDPFEGGKIAVAEAARNLVCSGARPLAITNCLNFGNPMKPEVFWQFRRCIEGIAEACRAFGTPVTGGNVSFYNESPAGAIDPTPVIGMLGIVDDPAHITTQCFKDAGDVIILLGPLEGEPVRLDLAEAKRVHDTCLGYIRQGIIKSAHDCSEGGLAVALAECCMNGLGASVELPRFTEARLQRVLFEEVQSRIIVTCAPEHAGNVAGTVLGTVGGDKLRIGRRSWPVAKLRKVWWNAIARRMQP